MPKGYNPVADGRYRPKRGMRGVDQLLARRKIISLGSEGIGGLGFLFGS